MKNNPRDAVNRLIKVLKALLIIYTLVDAIVAIGMIIFDDERGWVILANMLFPVIIIGVLIALLHSAFSDTIDEIERLDTLIMHEHNMKGKSKDTKGKIRIKSTPTVDVMSDDYDTFCDNVCAALENANEFEQKDWLEFWLAGLQALQSEEPDAQMQQLYSDEIAYLELSLNALEEESNIHEAY